MKLSIRDMSFSYDNPSGSFFSRAFGRVKSFFSEKEKNRLILDNISLDIGTHEFVSLMGPNGVGKTTLLKCINSILTPSFGSVTINDMPLEYLSPREIARLIGYVSQEAYSTRITVFDALLLGRYPHIKWRVTQNDLQAVNRIIEKMNLQKIALRYIDQLSGGELQKVSTARALVQEADFLLFDEPTSNLDLKNQVEILDLIRLSVKEHNVSALLTMHDINLALRYSDRLIFISQGKIFADCKRDEVTSAIIEKVYNTPVKIVRVDSLPVVIPEVSY